MRYKVLGRVHELRKMDKITHFEIKIGLLRKAESGFGLLKKQTFEPKGGRFSRFWQIREHALNIDLPNS